jgi:hypothetical protein
MATTAPIPTQAKANGLATCLSVFTAPRAAFAQLAVTPMWGWAALVGIVMTLVAIVIMLPEQIALVHIQQAKALEQMSADQAAQARQGMAAAAGVTSGFIIGSAFVIPWVIWLISAVVNVIGAAVSGAAPKFSLAWVVAVNASVVAFLGSILNAVIVAMHGPSSVASASDIMQLPSLGMLVSSNIKLFSFLYTFNILYIWNYVVAIIGLEQTMKMNRTAAIVTVVLYALIAGGLGAAFAR